MTPTVPDPLEVVGRHLAMVAVDGATDEVASTMTPDMCCSIDDLTTDRNGYLALIAARWAAEGARPALEVRRNTARGALVTVALAQRGLAYFQVENGLIRTLRLTTDWNRWLSPLHSGGAC
ncbi:MAG: hypothetical protein ACK5OX_08745 [Desertimonas sp.]